MNLNIRYDAPDSVWSKVPSIYKQMEGWIGYDTNGIPYWFSFDESEKYICASVEPSGLFFSGLMDDAEWELWAKQIKIIASQILGYKIGEIETGEVDY